MKKKLPYFSAIWIFVISILPSHFLQAQKSLTNQEMALFEKVVPNAYTSVVGTGTFLGPLAGSARTYQMLIAASELTDLVGKNLTSLSFRLNASATSAWPVSEITYSNYDIYLSESVLPVNRSLTFASNVVGTQTQVRSGSLVIAPGAQTSGASPNAFSYDINFTTPWLYNGGNALIEIRHQGASSSTSTDALLTSTSGYGTLFSACWTGNYAGTSGTQGNFAVIKLKGTDSLGTPDFESFHYTVYPNPVSDEIYIEASVSMNKITLFNMLGQIVLEEFAGTQMKVLDLSQLNTGTYLLQIGSEYGIKSQKVIKK